MREPSAGFEHESEQLERAAIKRSRSEEINWTPAPLTDAELAEVMLKHHVRVIDMVNAAMQKARRKENEHRN